jgi:cytochrome b561
MSWRSTRTEFGSLAIFLHWLMVLLIVAVYATMEFKSLSQKGSALREAMATCHFVLGLTIFALAWLRLFVRWAGPVPAIEPPLAPWDALLAKAAHFALYAFMVAMPLLGWLTLSAQGQLVPFFGFELPPLAPKSEDLARQFKQLHVSIATFGYFLIALHAVTALFHHYVKRDNTMIIMSPRR